MKTLLLCVLLAGVGGVWGACTISGTLAKDGSAVCSGKDPYIERIEKLEKRVDALEKGGVLVESYPTINPHPFGQEPEEPK